MPLIRVHGEACRFSRVHAFMEEGVVYHAGGWQNTCRPIPLTKPPPQLPAGASGCPQTVLRPCPFRGPAGLGLLVFPRFAQSPKK